MFIAVVVEIVFGIRRRGMTRVDWRAMRSHEMDSRFIREEEAFASEV